MNRIRKKTITDPSNKVSTTSYFYNANNQLLAETKEEKDKKEIQNYNYDKNGNQVKRQWEKYIKTDIQKPKPSGKTGIYDRKFKQDVVVLELRDYNGFDQLVKVYQDTMETEYEYRADGLRYKKLFADGTTTTHMWDGANIVAEYGANGKVFARYLRGIGLIARDQDNILQYYLHNGHGDVVERTDQNGTTLKNYDYDAFGVEESQEELDNNPFRYCGEYFDRESGTIYLRARNYSSTNGRFTSEDMHWNANNNIYGDNPNTDNPTPDINAIRQSSNLYAYCMGNPVGFADNSGKIAFFIATAIAGAVVGAIYGGITSAMQGNFSWEAVGGYALAGGIIGATLGAGAALLTAGSVVATSAAVGIGTNAAIAGVTVGASAGAATAAGQAAQNASSNAPQIYKKLEEGVNFSVRTAQHMENPARHVPVEVLIDAIKNGVVNPDPQGTKSMMYTINIIKNNKDYILEVLYNMATNTIWHFRYK